MNAALCFSALTAALGVWMLTARGASSADERVSTAERLRRDRLRDASALYRLCGGLLRRLAAAEGRFTARLVDMVQLDLGRLAADAPWQAREWVAAAALGAVAASLLGGAVLVRWLGLSPLSVAASAALGAALFMLAVRSLHRRARRRVRRIRARLPFVIDSIALAVECGASLAEGLAASIGGREPNEVQQELAGVMSDVSRGKSLVAALADLKARFRDPLIDEFVNTLATSHQLGCGVSGLLLAMASRMRQRRSHEIEAAAGRAQIRLYYPGLLLVVVCMAVVVAPFFAPMTKLLKGFMQ